ncbi:MAG: hypothetical protein LBL50_02560, partial [Candidatus Margulisbacteria bacterium]|nr:hypothetical protein [Candidatus Margulisiibacteriota bacterium]
MVSVSPDPNYNPLNNRPSASEGVSENNLSWPGIDLEVEPGNNRLSDVYDSGFQDLYEFVTSGIDKKEASDRLDELVNDGALDPADAAALNGLLSSPPSSVEDLIVRLPELDPEQITKITGTLASDQVFKFFHKEAGLGELIGQGKIAGIIVHDDARAPGLELKETTIAISDEAENILTGDIENLILTQAENGANTIESQNLRLKGKFFHNQVEIQTEEFEYSNPPAEDDLPSNTHNVSARNFSASGIHDETGAEWNVSSAEIQAEIDPDEQTGTAHNVNFEVTKDEHSLTGLASDLDLAAADNSRVDLPVKADNTPALTIAYQNTHNIGLDTLMTVESGHLQSAGSIFPENNELPFQRFPTEFYFQNVELRTDWGWANLAELSGRIENNAQDDQGFTVRGALAGGQYDKFKWSASLESGYGQKSGGLWHGLAQNISAAGAYAEHNVSLSAAEVSYAENSAVNIAKLAVSYGENIHANLDAFNFQRTPEALSVSMQNLGLRAWDIGFSLGQNDAVYNSQTNDWQTSASRLAARYGDYGFYLSSFSANYNNAAGKIEFAAENVHGVIDLAKPLPILSQ